MRKIEQAMVDAIRQRTYRNLGNTRVCPAERQDGKPLALVYLHDNHIATIGYRVGMVREDDGFQREHYHVKNVSVSLAGWPTRTTVSRLSAILRTFGADLRGVYTRKGEVYWYRRGGKDERCLRSTEWVSG